MAMGYNHRDMTVCLAGIYDEGKGVVLISDKLRSMDHPLIDDGRPFARKNDARKILKLNDNAMLAYASSARFGTEYIYELVKKVNNGDSYVKVLRKAEALYRVYRYRDVERTILQQYGFATMKEYNTSDVHPMRQKVIDEKISNYYCPFDLIIAGKKDGEYCVSTLHDPGHFEPNPYGVSVIGSGVQYALPEVTELYDKGMSKDETKDILLRGKKLAEADDAVGEETEIVCLP